MTRAASSIELGPGAALGSYQAPCEERSIPGFGRTWVHAYSGADAGKWRRAAQAIAGGREPSPAMLRAAQVVWVCRTAPGAAEHSFKLPLQGAREAFDQLQELLPEVWLREVCYLSDALALRDFIPPNDDEDGDRAAFERLGEQLGEDSFWAALSTLSLQLYGVPLAENGAPLGEVLTHLRHSVSARRRLVEALGPLAALVEEGSDG